MRSISRSPAAPRVRVRPRGPLGAALWNAPRVASLLLTGACAPVLVGGVFGDPAFVAPPPAGAAPATMRGCWVGSYVSPSFARRGRVAVTFHSAAGAQPADGSAGWVTLTPPAGDPACGPPPAAGAAPTSTADVQRIPLRAAHVQGGAVTVRSDAYWDADCGCTLVLTLTGRQVGDTLAGAFSARGAATAAHEGRGRWRVVRAASVARATR